MANPSVTPNDGKLPKRFEHHGSAPLERALATAQQGFQTWKRKTSAERAVALHQAAAWLRSQVDRCAVPAAPV
jgi:succinate-semialdehyde dehydrogenase / glutarate-semialdehyde dehydrogenase